MPQVIGQVVAFVWAISTGPAGSFSIGKFIARAVVGVALAAASRALFLPKAPKATDLSTENTVTVRDILATRKLLYGQARIGGTIVFLDVTDNNKFLHIVVAFCAHEVESFDEFYFDEDALTLTGNDVTAPSRYDGKAWVYSHTGADGQLADSDLVTASPQWSTNHRLRGIAYAYFKLEYDPQAFASGIPNITAKISGKKVYDPRTGSTGYSNNAALCAADYLMDSRYGMGVPQANVDMTVLASAANTADENVTLLAGGTEKRYTCNGVVDTGSAPKGIIESMATSKGAATVSVMGQWYVQAGAYQTPALSFDDDSLAGPIQVQTRHPRADLYNQVKGTYISPTNEWQPVDYPPVESSTYVTEDNGEVIYKEMDLPFTTSAARAQRLALLDLNRARRQITATARFNLSVMDVIPMDTIQLSTTRMGWNSKVFEVQDWQFAIDDDLSLGIELTLREIDSAVYTWSTADESAANAAPQTNLPDFSTIAAPTGLGVSTFQVPTQGGDETYKALLTWTAPTDQFVLNGGLIEITYKLSSDSTWLPSFYVNGSLETAEIILLEESETYDVRIRSYNGLAYSSWVSVLGFTVLGSGGVGTNLEWADTGPTWGTAGTFNEWADTGPVWGTVGTTNDWGAFV